MMEEEKREDHTFDGISEQILHRKGVEVSQLIREKAKERSRELPLAPRKKKKKTKQRRHKRNQIHLLQKRHVFGNF